MTITHVDVTLEMNVTIWVPVNAAQRVIDHEQGHRQISDRYYESADKIADEIAATYIGRQVPIAGTDLNAAATKALGELASEFTAEYGRRLDPEPTQQLYDDITDHSRNDTEVKDAVAIAIKNAQMSAIPASQRKIDRRHGRTQSAWFLPCSDANSKEKRDPPIARSVASRHGIELGISATAKRSGCLLPVAFALA